MTDDKSGLTYLRLARDRETARRCTPRRSSRLMIEQLSIGCERAYLFFPLSASEAYLGSVIIYLVAKPFVVEDNREP